jgi:hypothetical protein
MRIEGVFKKVCPARPQPLGRGAYGGVREHNPGATCLRVAASAKAGNTAGGFFQHSQSGIKSPHQTQQNLVLIGHQSVIRSFEKPTT